MEYVVQPGDSLWRISTRFCSDGSKWKIIAADNGIFGSDRVFVGQRLRIREALLANGPAEVERIAVAMPGAPQPYGASVIAGRAFLFVLADEINPLRSKVVRRVIISPAVAEHHARKLKRPVVAFPDPERFGFHPEDPRSTVKLGRHALGMKPSPFLSVSTSLFGAPRMLGRRYWIDVAKAKAAGATFHSMGEILADLDRIAPKLRTSEDLAKLERIRAFVRGDAEQLVRGSIPASAVKGSTAMLVTRGLQSVQIVGFVVTAVELGRAAEKSVQEDSIRPVTAEVVRQVGGWTAALAGAKLGAMTGVVVGIETGPGAIITGAVGGVVGGVAGYAGFDWIADHIDEN